MPDPEEGLPPVLEPPAEPPEEYVPPADATTVPLETFNSTYGKLKGVQSQLKQFGDLGTVEEIQKSQARLKQFETELEKIEERRRLTQGERDERGRAEGVRAELMKVLPALKGLDQVESLVQSVSDIHKGNASTRLSSILKTQGVNVPVETQKTIEDFILFRIGREGEDRLNRGDFSMLEGAVTAMLKDPMFAGLKVPATVTDPTPPLVRHKPGGQTPKPLDKNAEPMSWDKAADKAWDMLKSSA